VVLPLVTEILAGVLSGIAYGLISSLLIVPLAMLFKYFTNERFPWLISILLGLGIVGISGGLLAIVDEPTILSVTRIIVASMILVWSTNEGDKLASRLPKTTKLPFISSLGASTRRNYLTIKIPGERNILDLLGRPQVSTVVKKELEGHEFIFPADTPREELVKMLRRRLLTDWGLGDVEIELDQRGRIIYFSIGAKEQGLSENLKEGFVALPIKYEVAPNGLASGDLVQIYSGMELLGDAIEVKGVDEPTKTVTLLLAVHDLSQYLGKVISQIVVLPHTRETVLVADIMTREVRTVGPEASLRAAITLMNRYRIGAIVVMENEKAIGILTDRDLLQQIGKRRIVDIKLTKVKELMSTPLVEISPKVSAEEAVTIMRNRRIKKLPVVLEGILVGIITSNDILRLSV